MAETRTRRRGEQLEQAILDAAWAELKAVGYAKLTIEGVAARAGTSKPVIYRRWTNRAELVLAAWRRQMPMRPETPDTGALRTDLLSLFRVMAFTIEGMMSEAIAGVLGEAFRHPEITQAVREQLSKASPVTSAVETIVRRAVDRGELGPVDLPLRAARIPMDLIRHEFIVCAPVTDKAVQEMVDDVFLPLLHGLARRASRDRGPHGVVPNETLSCRT